MPFLRNITTTTIAARLHITAPIAMYISISGSSACGVEEGEGDAVGVDKVEPVGVGEIEGDVVAEGAGVEPEVGVGEVDAVGVGEGEGDGLGDADGDSMRIVSE